LLLTDAPLLQAPGVIAAAALRSAFRTLQLPCHQFLRHIAQRGMQQQQIAAGGSSTNGSNGSLDAAAAEQRLLASMAEVDDLAVRQGQIDEAALQSKAAEVDRTIKLWKKSLQQQQRNDSKGGSVPPPAVGAAGAMS
jgi:hypothetical protein